MTNQAMLSLLDYLCNEARNSVHATFGLMELLPSSEPDAVWRTCLYHSRSSADRLLRSIDDIRELLSINVPVEEVAQEFDITLCLGETIELLNLASSDRASRLILDPPAEPFPGRQHLQAVEQALIRVLDIVLKLTHRGEVRVTIQAALEGAGVRFHVTPPDLSVAERLTSWLTADPEHADFQSADDVLFAVGAMVAGRRLRALGGSAEFVNSSSAVPHLAIALPWSADRERNQNATPPVPGAAALEVLVVEDCDESYALIEVMLRSEHVWRAPNGLEAIDVVEKRRFDLVLMDVHMPGMDGYQAIQTIRDWETRTGNARTPIMVLSSDDLETQRRSAAQSGCSGFLRKPLARRDLLDVLDRLKSARLLSI
jgi:CheY-like chemotaxis protein